MWFNVLAVVVFLIYLLLFSFGPVHCVLDEQYNQCAGQDRSVERRVARKKLRARASHRSDR